MRAWTSEDGFDLRHKGRPLPNVDSLGNTSTAHEHASIQQDITHTLLYIAPEMYIYLITKITLLELNPNDNAIRWKSLILRDYAMTDEPMAYAGIASRDVCGSLCLAGSSSPCGVSGNR